MFKTFVISSIAAFSVFFISCDKGDNRQDISGSFDTIKPMEYFPAYPGSYWVYDSGDTLKVAVTYEKYVYNSSDYTAEIEILLRLISHDL